MDKRKLFRELFPTFSMEAKIINTKHFFLHQFPLILFVKLLVQVLFKGFR